MVDIFNHLPSSYVRAAIYSGGGIPTRAIHASYMTPWLWATLPSLLSPSLADFTAAANEFLLGCFYDPNRILGYDARAHWLGEMLMVPPQTRVNWEGKTRETDATAWQQMIKTLPVLVIQGRQDKLLDSVKMKEAFRVVLGLEQR